MRVCLITPGQPSTNPRLVKEADSLTEAGHDVTVIAGYWGTWALPCDAELLSRRPWTCRYVGGNPSTARLTYLLTRFRNGAARRALRVPGTPKFLARWGAERATPELTRAAKATSADLYIGHNLAALPACVEAARANGALAGFDCEDFIPGIAQEDGAAAADIRSIRLLEERYLPLCDYIVAASPMIRDAYESVYGVRVAASLLNVFPLSQRPAVFRPTERHGPLTLYWTSQAVGPGRGIEDAIKAMGVAQRDILLYIRGDWFAGYRAYLEALARAHGVDPERILSLPVEPSSDNMVRLASDYDVGLALERRTGGNRDICLTNKIFTYILAGNATVLSDTPAQREFAAETPHATFCYEPDDYVALGMKLRNWFDDRDAVDAARRNAWALGGDRYNWDHEKMRLLPIINDMVEQRKYVSA